MLRISCPDILLFRNRAPPEIHFTYFVYTVCAAITITPVKYDKLKKIIKIVIYKCHILMQYRQTTHKKKHEVMRNTHSTTLNIAETQCIKLLIEHSPYDFLTTRLTLH